MSVCLDLGQWWPVIGAFYFGGCATKKRIRPNWYAVEFDETEHCHIDENDKQFLQKITGVYIYDRNSVTHCCEFTPSYCLEFVYTGLVFKDDTPDDIREELQDKYGFCDGDDGYMHCDVVDAVPRNRKYRYGRASKEGREVREYIQCNCPF